MIMAVRPRASCRKFLKTCSSAEGSRELVGSSKYQYLGGAHAGPGQGELLPLSYGELYTVLELAAQHGLVAVFQEINEAGGAGGGAAECQEQGDQEKCGRVGLAQRVHYQLHQVECCKGQEALQDAFDDAAPYSRDYWQV